MKLRRLNFLIVFWSLIILFPVSVQAEEWVVGSMEKFAPFNFERNGIYDGIDTRILNEAAKNIDVVLNHLPRPWKRAIKDLERKKTIALFQLSGNGDWFEKYYPVGPIRPNKRMLFVTNESAQESFEGYDNFKGFRIGVIKNFSYSDAFDKAVKEKKIIPIYYSKPRAAVRALNAHRIEGVIETYEIFRFAASTEKLLGEFRELNPPISENERYIVFHRDEAGLEKAKRLQAALDKMWKTGRIKEIIDGFR